MPRPRGGDWLEDEVHSLRESGVDVVVSLLEREEAEELDVLQEEACCKAKGVSFLSFPIRDRDVPTSIEETRKFVSAVFEQLDSGKNVAVHCRAGIGRSSLIAACVLVLSGIDVDEAFARIEKARGCFVPDTQEQREWVARVSQKLNQV